jgi:LmbE family N-acetylglucosaminyl deacetylase
VKLKQNSYDLVVVAHPDDETIFFSGLILKSQKKPWFVICVTDGGADGAALRRRTEFKKALTALKCQGEQWEFKDIFENRLPVEDLVQKLKSLPTPSRVFTHGILGDYGHPHHQDVSYATHLAFAQTKTPVFSIATNCQPDLVIQLPESHYKTKTRIFSKIYFSETERFVQILPAHSTEAFAKLRLKEVESLYQYFANSQELRTQDLYHYRWLLPYFPALRSALARRPF